MDDVQRTSLGVCWYPGDLSRCLMYLGTRWACSKRVQPQLGLFISICESGLPHGDGLSNGATVVGVVSSLGELDSNGHIHTHTHRARARARTHRHTHTHTHTHTYNHTHTHTHTQSHTHTLGDDTEVNSLTRNKYSCVESNRERYSCRESNREKYSCRESHREYSCRESHWEQLRRWV